MTDHHFTSTIREAVPADYARLPRSLRRCISSMPERIRPSFELMATLCRKTFTTPCLSKRPRPSRSWRSEGHWSASPSSRSSTLHPSSSWFHAALFSSEAWQSRRHSVVEGLDVPWSQRPIEWGRARGATTLDLTVWEFNQAALAFYERLGLVTLNRVMQLEL